MPMPAATSAMRDRLRAASLKMPYGPSMATRVPGRMPARLADPDPRARTVMRSVPPRGAADNEYGCACHHCPRARNRQTRN
jgi:hypothetical protein